MTVFAHTLNRAPVRGARPTLELSWRIGPCAPAPRGASLRIVLTLDDVDAPSAAFELIEAVAECGREPLRRVLADGVRIELTADEARGLLHADAPDGSLALTLRGDAVRYARTTMLDQIGVPGGLAEPPRSAG